MLTLRVAISKRLTNGCVIAIRDLELRQISRFQKKSSKSNINLLSLLFSQKQNKITFLYKYQHLYDWTTFSTIPFDYRPLLLVPINGHIPQEYKHSLLLKYFPIDPKWRVSIFFQVLDLRYDIYFVSHYSWALLPYHTVLSFWINGFI